MQHEIAFNPLPANVENMVSS